jgi:hypothetical protein
MTIYYPGWWIIDIITVLVHMSIVFVLAFPVIGVWFYVEIVQARYRVCDPRKILVDSSY